MQAANSIRNGYRLKSNLKDYTFNWWSSRSAGCFVRKRLSPWALSAKTLLIHHLPFPTLFFQLSPPFSHTGSCSMVQPQDQYIETEVIQFSNDIVEKQRREGRYQMLNLSLTHPICLWYHLYSPLHIQMYGYIETEWERNKLMTCVRSIIIMHVCL